MKCKLKPYNALLSLRRLGHTEETRCSHRYQLGQHPPLNVEVPGAIATTSDFCRGMVLYIAQA